MNVYDEAHALTRALKESDEYQTYVQIKDKVSQNAELSEMLNDFQQKQFQLQAQQVLGGEIGPEWKNRRRIFIGFLRRILRLLNICRRNSLSQAGFRCLRDPGRSD